MMEAGWVCVWRRSAVFKGPLTFLSACMYASLRKAWRRVGVPSRMQASYGDTAGACVMAVRLLANDLFIFWNPLFLLPLHPCFLQSHV